MKKALGAFALLLAIGIAALWLRPDPAAPIEVGVLHSLTGTMAFSEQAVVDATLAAIDEVNRQGGVLGRPLKPVVVDGASDPVVFAQQAQSLLVDRGIEIIFGAWTSASRKELRPVIEAHEGLLLYPVQFEGLEASPSIVYLAQVPNQQIKPSIKWAIDHLGDRFFLIGSDYIFPRAANSYLKEVAAILGAEVIDEHYVRLGEEQLDAVVEAIYAQQPDAIFNTLNGDSNLYFFEALQRLYGDQEPPPVISYSIAENEVAAIAEAIGPEAIVGHYASWNYFASIDSPQNRRFKQVLREYGITTTPNDPMAAAYTGVWLFKQAAEACNTVRAEDIKRCFYNMTFNGPAGVVVIERGVMNAWQHARIGQVNADLDFDIVWSSDVAIQPDNFPYHRSRTRWLQELEGLYEMWNQSWSAP